MMNFWKRYPADYARKTARLTLAQHGAYTLLLDEVYTSEKPLPLDLVELYRICRAMTKAEQGAVHVVANLFFPVGADGFRHNKRAVEEIDEAAPVIEAARANGARGGRPKKPSGLPDENPAGSQNKTQKEPSSKAPQNLRISESSPSLRYGEDAPSVETLVQAGFDERSASEFIAYKARLKAPLTARAWRDHLREAEKAGWSPLAAADKVMAKGWKGFEAKYVAGEDRNGVRASYADQKATAAHVTVASGAADRTAAYLEAQRMTPEEKSKSDVARKAAMASLTVINRGVA